MNYKIITKSVLQTSGFAKICSLTAISILLSACGSSGTGAENSAIVESGSNNEVLISPVEAYLNLDSSAEPNTDDVQAFMVQFWNNVAADDRCGQCHDDSHAAPFARTDDINAAYSATTSLINRDAPQSSALVAKVEGGHQCWESSDSACAQILTRWIQNWVNAGNGSGVSSTSIILEKPDEVDISEVQVLPAEAPSDFTDTLYPLLTEYCSDCHSETADTSQQPFFASALPATAWDAARTKIDIEDENRNLLSAQSRLVVRLRSEAHNCWSNCTDNATEVLDAIQLIGEAIEPEVIDPALKISGGMILTEGTVASSGGRYEQHQIAFWNFSEGSGGTAFDTSGVEPAMHLSVDSGIEWVGGWGIELDEGDSNKRAWANTSSSKKLYDNIALSGEYSVEAWVAPANVTQEDAFIISYASDTENQNFTIGQTLYNYDFFQKTTIDEDGANALSTNDDDEDLQATLQHIVMTYDRENGRRIYVNGQFTDDVDEVSPGFLTNWNDNYVFSIGNEPVGNRPWQGMVRMVAIHNRALDSDQVLQNYDVGVGQKYFLLFDVTALVDINDCWDSYIVFEASQLDNYAYRFNNPFFARLYEADTIGDCTASTAPAQVDYSFDVTDIRLGINGKVVDSGQAYRNVGRDESGGESGFTIDTESNAEGYQQLSELGTVFPIENGPVEDLFFLSFGVINGESGAVTDPAAISVSNPLNDEAPSFGLRTFDEINASMSEVTGIATTNANVVTVFNDVKTQLPTSELAETFLAAHQIGVAQMAITYCNELVEQEVAMALGDRTFFTTFDFTANPATAFADDTERDKVYDPLISQTVGSSLNAQPTTAEAKANFDTLLDGYSDGGEPRSGLLDCGTDCNATRTQTIVKSLCAASIGSAMLLIQ